MAGGACRTLPHIRHRRHRPVTRRVGCCERLPGQAAAAVKGGLMPILPAYDLDLSPTVINTDRIPGEAWFPLGDAQAVGAMLFPGIFVNPFYYRAACVDRAPGRDE